MRLDTMFLAGVGVWLPQAVSVRSLVERGEYAANEAAARGMLSILIAEGRIAPPEMAVCAARDALARAAVPAGDIGLALHSSMYFQGIDMWPAASYIAHEAVGRGVPGYEIAQQANGGMAALQMAALTLAAGEAAGDAAPAALISTADRFSAPRFDRWRTDGSAVYGDGATAVVVSRRAGFARLLSVVTRADNSMEEIVRGSSFYPAPLAGRPLDLQPRKDDFSAATGMDFRELATRPARVIRAAMEGALAEAGVDLRSISRVISPVADRRLIMPIMQILGIDENRTTWDWGRRTGSMGAGDQFAALHWLVRTGTARPGDRLLMVGAGAGFSSTAAVIEILQTPSGDHP
ncbi:ketoacyl-ACP synthase III family protein [Microbispora sp. NPDC049125]|uniref:ketoacyl-ACP synthase III family protein n=1 Tax=Microbispora sp. NPDC049125 TaxID=3154929 RepID=UPI0034675365